MSETSPRPWKVEPDSLTLNPPIWFIVDAKGANVTGGFLLEADANLIVNSVNEIENIRAELNIITSDYKDLMKDLDRMKEIIRCLLNFRRGNVAVPMDMEKQILAEARAAIVEDKK